MGQPILAFLGDEFRVSRRTGALVFALATLALGFVCVWLYPGGAFDEFDFWTGTFSLVVFALAEVLVFGWVFGIDRGWDEITRGAEIRIPRLFRFVIRYVTPAFILAVFVGALVQPAEGAWNGAFASLFAGDGWPLAPDSVIGRVLHLGSEGAAWFDAAGRPTVTVVQDGTRLLLVLVFLAWAGLVHVAWRRHDRPSGGAPTGRER